MHRHTRTAMLLLAAACGCTGPAKTAPPAAAAPAAIVYAAGAGPGMRVLAVAEDGSGAAVQLSAADVPTTFVAALPGRRALLAERDADTTLTRLVAVAADGGNRVALADLPTGRYLTTGRVLVAGNALLVELSPADGPADVYVLRPGAGATLLADRAALVAVAGDRAVLLAGPEAPTGLGDARSVHLDGTDPIALGGGGGQDRVAAVRGELVLLTIHASTAPRVRLVQTDGAALVAFGADDRAEAGFALTATRALFTRAEPDGRALFSAALDGTAARRLGPIGRAATPLALTADERALFTAGADLLVADPVTGTAVTLDTGAGEYHPGPVTDGTLLYTAATADGLSLRAVPLGGGAPRVLAERSRWLPTPVAVQGGRVVFHRGLAGKPEGGRLYSVKLDGTDLQPFGALALALDGTQRPPADDQDFFAVTPAGRVIFEAEFEGTPGSALLAADTAAPAARTLADLGPVGFAGILP